MENESRLHGGLWGAILGDVLGVPVEFRSRDELLKSPVLGLRSFGTHHQPEGTWSDDTSLLLCSVENILEHGDLETLMKKFLAWADQGLWTPGGVVFDIGIATREAISQFRSGETAELSGSFDEWSNGNGSLMRILPYSYFFAAEDSDTRRTGIFKVSSVTHAHSRSKLACWFYTEVVKQLLLGKNKAEAVDLAHIEIDQWAAKNNASAEWSHFSRCRSDIGQRPLEEIKSTGYVVDSLEAALYSFLKTDDVMSSLLFAVNLGNDTDTIGSLTGGLAGTYYGFEGIDSNLLNKVRQYEEITKLVGKFVTEIL